MKKIIVVIARLVREQKSIMVEVPDDFESWDDNLKEGLGKVVYAYDDGSEDWLPDDEWGCEEGTHGIISDLSKDDPNLKIDAEYKARIEDDGDAPNYDNLILDKIE